MTDRSDEAIVGRLIERARLLIALSDEIPVETKLNTQAVLKMFEASLVSVESEADRLLATRYYQQLCDELHEYADIDALLGAVKTFVPYL